MTHILFAPFSNEIITPKSLSKRKIKIDFYYTLKEKVMIKHIMRIRNEAAIIIQKYSRSIFI
jgi:hypothetical protein